MRSSGFVCQACNPTKRQKQQKLRGLATMEIFTVFKTDFFPHPQQISDSLTP